MNLFQRVKNFFSRRSGRSSNSRNASQNSQRGGFLGLLSRGKSKGSQPTNYATRGSSGLQPMTEIEPTTDFGGSRTTIPKFMQGGAGAFGGLPRRARRELGLDDRQLQSTEVDELLELLADAHPDISFALWNFLRIGNSDYTINVYRLNGRKDTAGQRAVDEFVKRLEIPDSVENFQLSRNMRKTLNSIMQTVVLRGAGAVELVLTPGMDDVAFIAPVDPSTIEFYFENDRYVPYQNDGEISLDIPTFIYEGLDEAIDSPYGRSPILASINMIMFQLQVLNDIKAVVHNQGYPRLDIKVLEEVLLKRMPISIRNNEAKKQEWLNRKLQEIIDAYNGLEPDDTFVHFDSVEIDMVGGGSRGALIDPEKLFKTIDNLIMGGLKTMSTILGRNSSGNTEAFAKLEVKLYLKGVEAIQEVVERIMSRALTLLLNIQGRQGIVEFKFEPAEIRTDLEKAQFEQIAMQNYAYMRDQGWIDQDEASNRAVGRDAVAEPNWEALGGTSTVSNKEGEPISGQKDEKGTTAPIDSPSDGNNN